MISKEKYVLDRIEHLVDYKEDLNEHIHPELIKDLIIQWKFDYDVYEKYDPEILETRK